jgi:asparagine synthase (glutamine-hydrolysing)
MCGIAAIFAYGNAAEPVDREELLRMRERMFARGPDGAGEWISQDGRVGLANRRLAIIDLSPAGDQPMFNADRSLAIVFNGEIYNYRDLREQLVREGRQLQSHCDTEVVLELYATRGDGMLNHLRGMYAFAIWDRNKEGLFVARDPFGIKPLYYSNDSHTIRFASEIKALRAGRNIDNAPDPAGHVGFFLWGHVPEPYTMFRSIRSVPAGSSMWIDRNGPREPKKFCDISSILRQAEQVENRESRIENRTDCPITNNRKRAERLRSVMSEAVQYHLVADVPVGVFLSAGLDSTAITALAAEQGGDLRTVTLGFDEYRGTDSDETPLAEQFAKRCGANHQTIWVTPDDFAAERDHLFDAMDSPSIDGVNTFFVSLAAKRAGLKVALSGLGGDELFGSYPSFRDIPRTVTLLSVLQHWRNFGARVRVLTAPLVKQFTSPKYAGLFEYGGSYSGAYLLRRGLFMPWELPTLIDPNLARAGWEELQPLLRLDETVDGITNPRLRVSALEMNWYMRNQLLRDADWAGMAHSIEIRVPFVDVELLRALGPLLASDEAPPKQDMARAVTPNMSAAILNRRKTGFQVPVREWLMQESRNLKVETRSRKSRNRESNPAERGLRGWAQQVYRRFAVASFANQLASSS